MKFDRFLAALFSKRTLLLILVLLLSVCYLTACTFTFEDAFCLFFFGCPTLSTCQEWMKSCDCDCDGTVTGPDGERVDCNRSNCIGEAYNGCFGCVWDACLSDCRPSAVCDSCGGSAEDDGYAEEDSSPDCTSCDGGSASCEDCMLECVDAFLFGK